MQENRYYNDGYYNMSEFGIPWIDSAQLRQEIEENGVNYEEFMECLKCAMTPKEISQELGMDEHTAQDLTRFCYENGLIADELPID